MDGLILAFQVVFPLFMFMGIGFAMRSFGIVEEEFLRKVNVFIFKLPLPCVIFLSIYNSDFHQNFNVKLIATAIGLTLLSFAILMTVIPRIEGDDRKRAVMIQGMFRSNFILFGLPVAQTICGEAAIATMAMVMAMVVPLFNGLSVFVLEYYSGKSCKPLAICKSILKNPIIIGALLGFGCQLLGLHFPVMFTDVIDDLSKTATPMALLALGGTFHFNRLGDAWRQLVVTVAGRLLISPILFLTIAILLGFRGTELVVLFCMISSPTAVSSYTMAQTSGADYQLAGQIVVMTSLCSVGSIFLWVMLLENLQFI